MLKKGKILSKLPSKSEKYKEIILTKRVNFAEKTPPLLSTYKNNNHRKKNENLKKFTLRREIIGPLKKKNLKRGKKFEHFTLEE